MKRFLWSIIVCIHGVSALSALTVQEILSNPVGTDDGREWIEIYNESSESVSLSALSISIKGGTPVSVTPVQGGTVLAPYGYAIVSSTVSSQSKFLQDYPSYSGILMRASISLVNTGVTSLDIRLQGSVVDSVPSYTGAKEGSSLSKTQAGWVTTTPSPGTESTPSEVQTSSGNEETPQSTSVTVTQQSLPSPDIVLYAPFEKVVVAGADTLFEVSAVAKNGKALEGMNYLWAFGDGGRAIGSSTAYNYSYPGNYVAQVEGHNTSVIGVASIRVRVVSPEITITSFGSGKRGPYIDIHNANTYDLDVSHWKISINGALFSFPKHTLLGKGGTTRFSGSAMGFASTTLTASTTIKILFPNNEEVTAYIHQISLAETSSKTTQVPKQPLTSQKPKEKERPAITSPKESKVTIQKQQEAKDRRLVLFFKSLFE